MFDSCLIEKVNIIFTAAFVLIYKHLVRSHLEYNNSVWAPYRKLDIDYCILWSQSKQRNEVADAKPVVLTLKVKFFKTKIVILILS